MRRPDSGAEETQFVRPVDPAALVRPPEQPTRVTRPVPPESAAERTTITPLPPIPAEDDVAGRGQAEDRTAPHRRPQDPDRTAPNRRPGWGRAPGAPPQRSEGVGPERVGLRGPQGERTRFVPPEAPGERTQVTGMAPVGRVAPPESPAERTQVAPAVPDRGGERTREPSWSPERTQAATGPGADRTGERTQVAPGAWTGDRGQAAPGVAERSGERTRGGDRTGERTQVAPGSVSRAGDRDQAPGVAARAPGADRTGERARVAPRVPEQAAERTQYIAAVEPERAAPRRILPAGEAKAEPEGEERGAPAKSRRGVLVAAVVVVVLALAAGAVFLVPGLADKLGIGGGVPAADIAPAPPAVEFNPTLRGPSAQGAAPTPAGVQAALAGPIADPALGTLTGEVLDPATGQVLFSQDPKTPLVPASTTKLLTTAAALLALPHAEQLTTKVVQGDKPGTAIIVGGGDVTLNSLPAGKQSVYAGSAHLDDLVKQVKATGGVDTVLLDLDRYTGDPLAKGWLEADIAGGNITPMVPAMLDGGRSDPTKDVSPRSANPARSLAEEFAQRLGATVPAKATAQAPEGAKVLGEVRSAPVVELVDNALQRSDNVLAEALAREVARAKGKPVSFTGARDAVLQVLQENGFDTTGVVLADGSGLSTENRISADLLVEVLKVAAAPDGSDPRAAKLRPLLGGLPVAGGSGTLAGRYAGPQSAIGKGWVRAKTGTLSGVNSLAGVVLDTDGRVLVFALMSNGSVSTSARPALDAVAAALRGCGCR
ncbi:D-alanyl-D-alanine carboxypeptidase/D-alanyl-D-alanine-endopeptidase [Actinokineospora bangkokensis]|uniref:D-alanyl-D-alanine carboxypeptidase/D-alanyl-D-alanine-endopeptidase n=1 Tax=Actinokineospora bangkokensis TaxID=1193682 RepID=A0A1Q9LCL1_9PSEU|nr:D-alanyl-D-alanine carboxypeptidase/D-alanyl-D-alanine-endopeptidase [Actinokineospora bangkokensis]